MNSGLNFLVAARQCEISELEHLALTSALVNVIGQLVHALQKERGISNVFLASRGERFGAQRMQQVEECLRLQAEVQARFDGLDTDASRARNGARLFTRIAYVLQALDGLPALRARIAGLALTPETSTTAYTRLIAGLMGVVFDAADSAADPEIARALVALFHFMQGKEYAGQERALGSAAYASGRIDPERQQQWQHLVEAQNACFQVFQDFSGPNARAAWTAHQDAATQAAQDKLRRAAMDARLSSALDVNASLPWYEHCTRRIDAMRKVEDALALHLRSLCEQRIAQARAELRDQQASLQALLRQSSEAEPAATPLSPALSPHLERSVLGMVQEQSRRLQAMSDELATARAALHVRKVIERAKGLLMASRKLSEEEAHTMLRQTAMNQGKRLVDVAQTVLSMSDYL
jgi:hypothetical protein